MGFFLSSVSEPVPGEGLVQEEDQDILQDLALSEDESENVGMNVEDRRSGLLDVDQDDHEQLQQDPDVSPRPVPATAKTNYKDHTANAPPPPLPTTPRLLTSSVLDRFQSRPSDSNRWSDFVNTSNGDGSDSGKYGVDTFRTLADPLHDVTGFERRCVGEAMDEINLRGGS